MDWRDYIHADPAIMVGKPVIKGTRIPVELILEHVAFGRTIDEILHSYPRLQREQVLAALQYALDECIHADPAIMVGKRVIKGTRIPVDLILEKLAFESVDEILLDYPYLEREQLHAIAGLRVLQRS